MSVNVISRQELETKLFSMVGSVPVTIVAETEPKMNKTGNPYLGNVVKVARVNGMAGFDYEAGVDRRRDKQDGPDAEKFVPGESWHTLIQNNGRNTPLCAHKTTGVKYLRIMHGKTLSEEYRNVATGEAIDKTALEPFLPKTKNYARQGLDAPLKILVYKIDGIRSITMDKTDFVVAG